MSEVTLDAYAKRICEALAARAEPAVLVGHSMGGMAITQAAPRCADRIASMVYVAAFLPQDGQSLIGLTELPEGEGDQVQANLVVTGDPPVATMPAEASRAATYEHCSDELAAWAIASRTPQPIFPFTEPVALEGFDFAGIPRAYVYCAQDRAIPPPLQRRMLETAGCEPVVELDTDHVPQLSRTTELAEILDGWPRRVHAMPPPMPHVAGVEHREVDVRGLRLHVAFAGPPAGAPGRPAARLAAALVRVAHLIGPLADAGYRVIAPDFRGFGWSEYPPDEDFRKETLVDDLIALCAELGYERISLVGHDWGCWVGWLLCLRRARPDRARGAALGRAAVPARPRRPGGGRAAGPAGLPAAARRAAAVRSQAASLRRWATCSAGAPPDEVEVYAATLAQPLPDARDHAALPPVPHARARPADRAPLRRAAPDRAGALPGGRRGPALLRGAGRRAGAPRRRRVPRRGAAAASGTSSRRRPRSCCASGCSASWGIRRRLRRAR